MKNKLIAIFLGCILLPPIASADTQFKDWYVKYGKKYEDKQSVIFGTRQINATTWHFEFVCYVNSYMMHIHTWMPIIAISKGEYRTKIWFDDHESRITTFKLDPDRLGYKKERRMRDYIELLKKSSSMKIALMPEQMAVEILSGPIHEFSALGFTAAYEHAKQLGCKI